MQVGILTLLFKKRESCVEKDIVIEAFISALMLIYSDVIMCYGRYVISSI